MRHQLTDRRWMVMHTRMSDLKGGGKAGGPRTECQQCFQRAQQRAPGSREEGISRQECWYQERIQFPKEDVTHSSKSQREVVQDQD